MAKKIGIKDRIISDIYDAADIICKSCATQVREVLAGEYYFAVEMFYNAYDPEYYKRTFNLYNGYVKYYKNSHGKFYTGGILVSAEPMKEVYKDPKEYVLSMAMMGYHGTSRITTESPLERLIDKQNEIVANPEMYIQRAINVAKKSG